MGKHQFLYPRDQMDRDSVIWRIDHEYRDAGVKSKKQGYPASDQFASLVSIDRSQNWGIKNAGGIRKLSSGKGIKKNDQLPPAAIFLITSTPGNTFHNPWEDSIDYSSGTLLYWGDAKYEKDRQVDSWPGNLALKKIHEHILRGEYHLHPPVFYFVREKIGFVTFRGVCVIEDLDQTWFMDKGRRVINYRFKLAVLDIGSVDPNWINLRAKNQGIDPDSTIVPSAWKIFIKTGRINRLIAWNTRIRTKEQQQPGPAGPGSFLLKKLEEVDPYDFEKIICRLLGSYKTIVHKVERARNVRDHGFDMEGEFILPGPFNYPIRFKGEVKRHKEGIGPKDVSRLVARLGRGEYGLFFTTSYFTADAQKEVLLDSYPVRLIAGADLYDYFYEAKMLDEKGVKLDELLYDEQLI